MTKDTCEMIRDLLPLYIDDCCSETSRKIVDEHLAVCPDCKQEWEEALEGGPVFLDGVVNDLLEKLSEEKPAETMKKGLKKVRKKWFISIIAIAVAVAILIPLCILGINQHRSYGVCFTSFCLCEPNVHEVSDRVINDDKTNSKIEEYFDYRHSDNYRRESEAYNAVCYGASERLAFLHKLKVQLEDIMKGQKAQCQ